MIFESKVREVLNEGEKNAETIVDLAEKVLFFFSLCFQNFIYSL